MLHMFYITITHSQIALKSSVVNLFYTYFIYALHL